MECFVRGFSFARTCLERLVKKKKTNSGGMNTMRISLIVAKLLVFAVLAPLLLIGCGGEKKIQRYEITGKVTYDGKPVSNGVISFYPKDKSIGGGFAMISDGQYDSQKTGRGHLSGSHTISITGFGTELVNPNNPDSERRPLFPTYEVVVDLPKKIETRDFDVPAKGK